ncbi:MAG: nuclear transport factor 2 family protein [Cyclobacteriaceae bacterium]
MENAIKYMFGFLVLLGCNATVEKDKAEVEKTLAAYKAGVESLSTKDLSTLFVPESQIYESGSDEGSFDHYLDHHLAPELKQFESFDFNDYSVSTVVDPPYAFATESYVFKIVLAKSGQVIEKRGIATSVLKKIDGKWKILKTHSSSRAKK